MTMEMRSRLRENATASGVRRESPCQSILPSASASAAAALLPRYVPLFSYLVRVMKLETLRQHIQFNHTARTDRRSRCC